MRPKRLVLACLFIGDENGDLSLVLHYDFRRYFSNLRCADKIASLAVGYQKDRETHGIIHSLSQLDSPPFIRYT